MTFIKGTTLKVVPLFFCYVIIYNMNIEEKLNLMGEVLEELDVSDSSSVSTTYTNETGTTLKLVIESRNIIEVEDENSNYDDFHVSINSKWNIKTEDNVDYSNGSSLIGNVGSNNKQYDHRTWDSTFYREYVKLKPGHKINYSINITKVNDGNHEKSQFKNCQLKFIVVGVEG